MKYLNSLIDFIKNNDNWEKELKKSPYNLKTIKRCDWNPNWVMFVYNLFNSDLSNYVVRACRGTVLDINGKDVKVVCYPYSKFDNYGSISCKDIEDSINWNKASFVLKVDGILIKTAKVGEKLYFFTNGSFNLNAPLDECVATEEATKNAKTYGCLLKYAINKEAPNVTVNYNEDTGEFYCVGGWTENIPEGSTLMFELTSPRNKIICKYDETKLWFHGFRGANFLEVNPRNVDFDIPYEIPEIIPANDIKELREILLTFKGDEKEGVVVADYSNPEVPRCKIKCQDYLKLKFTRDSPNNVRFIFKAVVDNEYDDLIANVPTVIPVVNKMKSEIKLVYDFFEKEYNDNLEIISTKSKKEWSNLFSKNKFKYIYMKMYDFKGVSFLGKHLLLSATCKNYYKTKFKELLEYIESNKKS